MDRQLMALYGVRDDMPSMIDQIGAETAEILREEQGTDRRREAEEESASSSSSDDSSVSSD